MKRIAPIFIAFCLLLPVSSGLTGPREDEAGRAVILTPVASGGYIRKSVLSLRERKFKNLVPQQFDFSCGAASLATILKYYYGLKGVAEEEIVKEMIEKGDPEKIRHRGFSLLDMKKHAERKGFQANGYKVKAENLGKLKIPVIALMSTRGYTHFVVLKGTRERTVFIADPAAGNRAVPLEEFAASWDGVILVVFKKSEQASPMALHEEPGAPVHSVLWLKEIGVGSYLRSAGEF